MKVCRILITIFLLMYPASQLWSGEPSLGWTKLSTYNPYASFYYYPQVAGTGNNIYIFTQAYDPAVSTNTINRNICYDLATNTCTDKAVMNVDRLNFRTAVINGKIYAIGGKTYADILKTLEEYDPVADTWTTRSPMPAAKLYPEIAVINNKLYTIGGSANSYSSYNISSMEEYDPATDTWTTKAPLPDVLQTRISCVVYNNKIYVFSLRHDNDCYHTFVTLQIYDPLTNTWENKETVTLDYFFPINTVLLDNKIYLINNTTYLYDPSKDTYQRLANCDTFYSCSNVVMLNNVLYTAEYYHSDLYRSVFTHPPVLAYTGEAGYEQDAIDPDKIKITGTYTFKIRYSDEDNDPPASGPVLNLMLDSDRSDPFFHSYRYFNMQETDPQDNNYIDGKEYYYTFNSSLIEGWPISYQVTARNQYGMETYAGDLMLELETAETEYPSFSPIEVSPGKGFKEKTEFTFRVKYTDPNNVPPSGKVFIEICKNHYCVESLDLNEENTMDTDYTDGKYYRATTRLDLSGDFTALVRGWNKLWLQATQGLSDTFTVTNDDLGELSAWNFSNWGEFTAGIPFDNTMYFCNSGTADTSVEVTYYVSPTMSLTDAYQLKILKYPEDTLIPANSYFVALPYSVWIPATIPPGSYYLGIKYKSSNDINEEEKQFWDSELIQVKAGLSYNHPGSAFCYPSPAYLSKGDKIHFAALPPNAEISIMLPTGHIIKKFTADDNGCVSPWDGATDNDGVIGSGVYLVSVSVLHSSTRRIFKILVFR